MNNQKYFYEMDDQSKERELHSKQIKIIDDKINDKTTTIRHSEKKL